MATESEVFDTLLMLVDANLSFPPKDIERTAGVWVQVLEDVPGDTLKQAALDLIISEKEFPKLATVRQAAHQVKVHNGRTAAANPFHHEEQRVIWEPSGTKDRVKFPLAVQRRLAELEALDRLLTDAEMQEIDRLTGEYVK